jgi:hypothetical protein
MTRCAVQFFHGRFLDAFRWNPLVFTALCGVLAFDVYAFAALTTRGPRWRICFSAPRAKIFMRVVVVFALLLNWMYLLLHWRNF